MQRSTDSSHAAGGARELAVLLAWLAAFGLALRLLVGGPSAPAFPESAPSWSTLQVWAFSPGAALDGVLSWVALLAWAVWAWTLASVLLRVLVVVSDSLTRGARWVQSLRLVSDWLTLPLVRRAVDTSLAGLMLARVVTQPALAHASSLPLASPTALVQANSSGVDVSGGVAVPAPVWLAPAAASEPSRAAVDEVTYTVRKGDTLSGIALAFYGDAAQHERIYEANLGRPQPGGRQFNRHGLILPGWTLRIPEPSRGVVYAQGGVRWYEVLPGDTLSGIAGRVLGNQARWQELFALNAGSARVGERGPVLRHPDRIWPGLLLRLPAEVPADERAEPAAASAPEAAEVPDAAPEGPLDEPGVPASEAVPDELSRAADLAPDASPVPSLTPTTEAPIASEPADVAPAASEPAAPVVAPQPATTATPRAETTSAPPPNAKAEQVGLAGAGAVAAALAAGVLVVRRRRPAPPPDGPESDIEVVGGFAQADPIADLARRLARTSDPPAAIASLLAQAYAGLFAEKLTPEQRREATTGVTLAATRHGKTSTTLVLAAPVPARPHLVRGMRAAAERAFGEHVDVDGLVSQDGDVLVRLTWDRRHPVPARVLELVGPLAGPVLWPAPYLVSLLALYDREEFHANWHTLTNLLIAAPTGQGADVPLTALVASLASVRRPEDLGLVLLARPHTLPVELGRLPHGLFDPVDPADPAAVEQALEAVRQELDRRRAGEPASDEPDLVVVVRELCDLEPAALRSLNAIAACGPAHRVRLVAASERPVADVLQACPFLDELGTRLVLQTRDEEESVALLGTTAAEDLGSGGHALLRLESRMPLQGMARQVPADHLGRLLSLMGTRAPHVVALPQAPANKATDDVRSEEQVAHEVDEGDETGIAAVSVEPAQVSTAAPLEQPSEVVVPAASPLLQQLRSAPIRVRCFGARDIWYGDRQLQLVDAEMLLVLAAHPIAGIRFEALAEMLWAKPVADPNSAVRKRRSRLRDELRLAAPGVTADPLPGETNPGVVRLNPEVVASDVHEFQELLEWAPTLPRTQAVQAYQAALALYRGDLLDSPDVPSFHWMFNVEDDVAVAHTLQSNNRDLQQQTRRRLADLLAVGTDEELGRAADLYASLCAEDPEDERLWTALFRVHERAGSVLGLQGAVRKLQSALAELAPGTVNVETVPLPPKLDRLVQEIRSRIGAAPESHAGAAGD